MAYPPFLVVLVVVDWVSAEERVVSVEEAVLVPGQVQMVRSWL